MERRITVRNKLGLHARPAAALVGAAGKYSSDIRVRKADDGDAPGADCKSILEVLLLTAGEGTELLFSINGDDADEAFSEISRLFSDKFGEE